LEKDRGLFMLFAMFPMRVGNIVLEGNVPDRGQTPRGDRKRFILPPRWGLITNMV
jgi:hypothetical protein